MQTNKSKISIKRRITLGDIILISAALLTAVLFFVIPFFTAKSGQTLTVTVKASDGLISNTYSLAENRELTIKNNGITLNISINDGVAYVSASNCRDNICKNSGNISRAGQSIVCAPAGVALTVHGGEKNADAVAG